MRRIQIVLLTMVAVLPGPARAADPPIHERVLVPMRDGVRLSVDIWRPATSAKVPVVLTLTPYHARYKALDRNDKDLPDNLGGLETQLLNRGYAYALADVRGTYNSGGCWDYGGIQERRDGYDLVEWLGGKIHDGSGGTVASPAAAWSSGKVAMIGASYDGTTANAAAVEAPPSLAAIVPISAISRWWGYAYQQGARSSYSGESVDADPPSDTPTDFMFAYGFVPPPDHDRLDPTHLPNVAMRWTLCDRVQQALHGYDTQPDYDDFWKERDYLARASNVTAAALVGHGFLDFNVKTWEGTAWFQALRSPKKLVAGQWGHALPAYGSWRSLVLKWFDRWLKGVANGVETGPAVHVASNAGPFRDQTSWGERPVAARALSGNPFTYLDDGLLTESEMVRGLSADRYLRVRVPDSAGLRIEGRPVLRLTASSDSTQTHFVAVLCEVSATGARTVISRAFLNARYRAGLEQGTDLTPGAKETFALEFIDKDWEVAAGATLELLIASSSATWVFSDEMRAGNTIYPAESTLELPLR